MILDTTSKSVRAFLGEAIAASNPHAISDWADVTATAFTPGNLMTVLNGTTPVTIVASPAASTQRQTKYLDFFNVDTIPHVITVEMYDGTNQRTLVKVTLEVGEQLIWQDGAGWMVLNAAGAPKAAGTIVRMGQLLRGAFDAANLTAALALASTQTFYVWLGVCPKSSSSITLRFRVTTAAVTITWAEAAVYRGVPVLAGNPALTLLGFANVAAVVNSVGLKSQAVSLSVAAQPGDELWAAIGNQATTAAAIRAALADDLQSGLFASEVNRPSTGGGRVPALGGAAVALPWITAFVS
jgi:hypothetical protein